LEEVGGIVPRLLSVLVPPLPPPYSGVEQGHGTEGTDKGEVLTPVEVEDVLRS